jgi:hydrogenase expression/formation protein HypC
MCIGIPMQVIAVEPGHAWCEGRGERRRVNTALVGACAAGDWLLIFLEGARECIDAERAAEVNAALDLIEGALMASLAGVPLQRDVLADPGFALPSAMSAEQVAALSGQVAPAASSVSSASPVHISCLIGSDHV